MQHGEDQLSIYKSKNSMILGRNLLKKWISVLTSGEELCKYIWNGYRRGSRI